ncbi:hypothetical protein GN330_07380 [Nitratireductor sp. CAU 1489]|uniref:Antifreeze protein n=1 Tax=Nitratireductor arenosus TaxID=2682096 RepID=A0A844QH30_9HYPH|nr:hypothetical protein [Nitratireductor arenosus]MVA97069.1 hypothetical protein [Nitratireductor arenosus]
MFNFIKTAALASLIGFGAIGASSTSALADGISIGIGGAGGHVSMRFGDGGRHWRGGRDFRRPACTTQRAVRKARRMGVRRAHVVRANHRVIKIRGRKFGHRVNVVFARAPRCPIVAMR